MDEAVATDSAVPMRLRPWRWDTDPFSPTYGDVLLWLYADGTIRP